MISAKVAFWQTGTTLTLRHSLNNGIPKDNKFYSTRIIRTQALMSFIDCKVLAGVDNAPPPPSIQHRTYRVDWGVIQGMLQKTAECNSYWYNGKHCEYGSCVN
jgi:hypothetical protein